MKQVYIAEEDDIAEEPAPAPDQSVRGPVPIRGRAEMTASGSRSCFRSRTSSPPPIVQRSELVKGYEYSKGQYVTISKEDLEKITPETAREMQILEFVKLAEVDPIYFETSYYVTPERAGERAYALLFEALRAQRLCRPRTVCDAQP